MSDNPPFDESPPFTDAITPYDWKHRIAYLRLLDARDDGAEWQEAVAIIFGLDVDADPTYAKKVHDNHLARADWMTKVGWRYLLEGRFLQ